MLLKGKTAVITGCNRGIGKAILERTAGSGANVFAVVRKETDEFAEYCAALSAEHSVEIQIVCADFENEDQVTAAAKSILKTKRRIDILVNNAGVSESTPFAQYTVEKFAEVMDLNVKGVFNCSRAASEHMVAAGSGVILNTSSMVSQYGQPAGIAYPTSKFAVNGFTLSLARELGPKGVRVNAVAPGITYTDMMRSVPKEVIEPMIAQIPLRRMGQPEDIASAFVFLASDMASYISGEVLHVDGLARS